MTAGSDENIKENITSLSYPTNSLDLISSLKIKSWTYKDDYLDANQMPASKGLTYTGYIAQDLQAINSEYVSSVEDPRDDSKTILTITEKFTTDVKSALLGALIELKDKNDALEARIAALEA